MHGQKNIKLLYPVYSLLWQRNYKTFPSDLQESNQIHVLPRRRREHDSVSADKQLQSLNKTRILDIISKFLTCRNTTVKTFHLIIKQIKLFKVFNKEIK